MSDQARSRVDKIKSSHGRSGLIMIRPGQIRSDNDKVWSGQDRSRQLRKISDQVRSGHVRLVNAMSGQATVRSVQVK